MRLAAGGWLRSSGPALSWRWEARQTNPKRKRGSWTTFTTPTAVEPRAAPSCRVPLIGAGTVRLDQPLRGQPTASARFGLGLRGRGRACLVPRPDIRRRPGRRLGDDSSAPGGPEHGGRSNGRGDRSGRPARRVSSLARLSGRAAVHGAQGNVRLMDRDHHRSQGTVGRQRSSNT